MKPNTEIILQWYSDTKNYSIGDYDDFLANCLELRRSEREAGGGDWEIPTRDEFERCVLELNRKVER